MLIDGKKALAERLARHGLDPQEVFTDNARRLFGEAVPLRQQGKRIVRLAEIEVVPSMLEDYMAFAKEVGETSMRVEPGVLTLFSMQSKEDPCKIYILEIYADREDGTLQEIQGRHRPDGEKFETHRLQPISKARLREIES